MKLSACKQLNRNGNKVNRLIYPALCLFFCGHALSQMPDTAKKTYHFSGTITATNNGISLIPTFSLGKPAAIFSFSMGSKRLSFDPEFRFALDGKPWSMIFWWRYKMVKANRFSFNVGAHPSFVFKTINAVSNGVPKDMIVANRYLAAEFVPTYALSRNITVGMYYLYSHGIDEESVQNTDFITLNASFSNIKLPGELLFRFNPQVYYLKQDGKDGYYLSSIFTLAKQRFPVMLQSIINKTIRTDIGADKDFVWNASILYYFNNNYVRHR